MDKLFVYGIFLDEYNRDSYGMKNPRYAVVPNYTTVLRSPNGSIVQAIEIENTSLGLTGLLVDMPKANWGNLDALEGGYDRVKVKTTSGVEAYMYTAKER